jgi:osmotically inducible protein OsmC
MAERTALVVWEGDLARGSGTVSVKSGALPEFPVTWASRTERSDGKTSPEELIAAAHGSCYSMGLTQGLAEAGTPAVRLTVKATCAFDTVDGAPTITTMTLDVAGEVPGIDSEAFEKAAEDAKEGCPVSRALKGNVKISLSARLA